MADARVGRNGIPWGVELAYAGTFGAAAGLFALLDPAHSGILVTVAAVGTGAALACRVLLRRWGREAGLAATVAVLIGACSLAPTTLAAEALAGLGAVALLLWAATDVRRPRPFSHRVGGVVLPGLALSVAVVISGILSGSTALVGVSVALVLAVILWVAYVLSRPDPFRLRRRAEEEAS